MKILEVDIEQYKIKEEPLYIACGHEEELFESCYRAKLPLLLKGPTGTAKTRFLENQAFKHDLPIYPVACHEDLTANDLVGRLLLMGNEVAFEPGPLYLAAKHGGIAYLDEAVEARKDIIVAIHPLTDYRRQLAIPKLGEVIEAHENFMLAVSYNPGYQNIVKDLKPSTKQRFASITIDYAPEKKEVKILQKEGGIGSATARRLVRLGHKIRNLKDYEIEEGASTRLLVNACKLAQQGLTLRQAIQFGIVESVTDDETVKQTIDDLVTSIFGNGKSKVGDDEWRK